jgi:hypothetical protein
VIGLLMLGFLGVLIIVRPGSALLTLAALLPLAAAVCNSLYQIITRKFRETENPTTSNFITGVVGSVLMSFTLPLSWTMSTPTHALLPSDGSPVHNKMSLVLFARWCTGVYLHDCRWCTHMHGAKIKVLAFRALDRQGRGRQLSPHWR